MYAKTPANHADRQLNRDLLSFHTVLDGAGACPVGRAVRYARGRDYCDYRRIRPQDLYQRRWAFHWLEDGGLDTFPIWAGLLECDRTPLQAGSDERSGDARGTLGGFGSQHLPRRQGTDSPDS